MTLEELLADYDWACVFGEDSSGGNCDAKVQSLGGASADPKPARQDVEEILASFSESGDYAEWSGGGVFRLKDGRFLFASGGCDTSGWD